MKRSVFTIGVFGVIFNSDNQVLLCHRRDYDVWNLPGGGLEDGETPQAGVIREVKEEVGLTVVVDRLVGVYSKPVKNDLVLAFTCHVTAGTPQLSDEADAIDYFSIDALPENTMINHIQRIHGAAAAEECVIRVQESHLYNSKR